MVYTSLHWLLHGQIQYVTNMLFPFCSVSSQLRTPIWILVLRHDTSVSADNSYSCPRVVGSPKPLLVLSEARGNMYPRILMGNLWISTSRHRTYK